MIIHWVKMIITEYESDYPLSKNMIIHELNMIIHWVSYEYPHWVKYDDPWV